MDSRLEDSPMDSYFAQSPFTAFAFRRLAQSYEDPFRRYTNRWRERQQHCKEVNEMKAQVAALLAENATLRQSLTNYQIIDHAWQRLFPIIYPAIQRRNENDNEEASNISNNGSNEEEDTCPQRPASTP